MKKHVTLVLLLGGMYAASAQVPFPSSNAVWTERHGNTDAAPNFYVTGIKTDDITIGSNTYHKVYRSANDLVLDATEYIGGLREDAVTKRVYFYNAATSAERLLYDFSLSPGDTIFTGTGGAAEGVVYAVDTVTIASVARRRLTFRALSMSTPGTDAAWVEGIGNVGYGGFLYTSLVHPTCDCGFNTVCYDKDGSELFKSSSYASIDCDAVFSTAHVNETFVHSTQVTVFPNPVTGMSHLQLTGNERYNSLTIADIMGKTIKTADVTGITDVALDKNSFAPGIYIYHLQNEAGSNLSGKFVVE